MSSGAPEATLALMRSASAKSPTFEAAWAAARQQHDRGRQNEMTGSSLVSPPLAMLQSTSRGAIVHLSMPTAMMMTRPIRSSCTKGDTPSSTRPLRMTPMISTPRMVPRMVPSPPDSEGAADDGRGDDVKLQAEAGAAGLAARQEGEAEDAGEGGERAHDHEGR